MPKHIFILLITLTIGKGFSQGFRGGLYWTYSNLTYSFTSYSSSGEASQSQSSHEKPFYYQEKGKASLLEVGAMLGVESILYSFNEKQQLRLSNNLNYGFIYITPLKGLSRLVFLSNSNYLLYSIRPNKNNIYSVGVGHNLQAIPFVLWNNNQFVVDYTRLTKNGNHINFRLINDLKKRTIYTNYSSEGNVPSLEFRNIYLEIAFYLSKKSKKYLTTL